jgi:tetratricopeptide (TPR) repeat protein
MTTTRSSLIRVSLLLLIVLWPGEARVAAADQPPGERPEQITARNARLASMNALMAKAFAALSAREWQEAETILKQLIEANPDANQWEFYQALGTAQTGLREHQNAIQSFEKGIALARDHPDPKADPAKIKAGLEQMLTSEGNAYVRLGKPDEAIARFTQAAAISPNPVIAYFNVCATLYNMGNMPAAATAADRAIAADPQKADAYFIKGSALFADGKIEGGRYVAPPESVAALQKYLELAPTGPHADDVKAMLDAIAGTPGNPEGAAKE